MHLKPVIARCIVLIIIAFAVALPLVSVSVLGATSTIRGERIRLHYPSTMSEEAAARLLANREAALSYVEQALGCTFPERMTLTFHQSAFGGGGRSFTSSIEFVISHRMIEEAETAVELSERFLGCHEETHVVVFNCWGRGASALNEGLASYLDTCYRGGLDYTLIARALLDQDGLPSLDRLPFLIMTDRFTMDQYLAIYLGGASLVEYLISTYGIDAFREFYITSKRPPDFAESAIRQYGRNLDELETGWHAHVRAETEGREHAAQLLLDTQTGDPELQALWTALGELSRKWPNVLGRSEVYENARDVRSGAVEELQAATSDQAADSAHQRYQCTTAQMAHVLKTWLEAATAYRDFLESRDELTIPEQAQLLRKALDNYSIVGDDAMIEAVESELIELQSGQ